MFAIERDAILKANPWLPPWSEKWVDKTGFGGPGGCGWARAGRLTVAPPFCQRPGRGYSWPGSCSDRTVRGVYLHEVGHVVHYALGDRMVEVLRGLREVREPRVSGYEPDHMETFAETFRLFAGNPGLLLAGRPRRFEYLVKAGVAPAFTPEHWTKRLAPRPAQRFLDMCERWIAKNKHNGQGVLL